MEYIKKLSNLNLSRGLEQIIWLLLIFMVKEFDISMLYVIIVYICYLCYPRSKKVMEVKKKLIVEPITIT